MVVLLSCLALYGHAASIPNSNICFDNINGYGDPHLYYWNVNPSGELPSVQWPGIKLLSVNNFYCHNLQSSSDTVNVNSMNIIFNNNGAEQTADLSFQNGNNCYQNGTWKTLRACGFNTGTQQNTVLYFHNEAAYNEPYIHYFNLSPAQQNSNWPGEAMRDLGNNWFSFEFSSTVNSGGIVFSDSGANQSVDLTFAQSTPCFQNNRFVSIAQCQYTIPQPSTTPTPSVTPTPTATATPTPVPTFVPTPSPNPDVRYNYPQGNAIYFVNTNSFSSPTAYLWNALPQGSMPNSNWPGNVMSDFGGKDLWYIEIDEEVSGGNIIFNDNGANQTVDLQYQAERLCYREGIWMTPEECGVPLQSQIDAGPDRQVNQNSQIQLLPVALSDDVRRDISQARWTSDAWDGELTGANILSPLLNSIGSFTVTLTLATSSGNEISDSFVLTVVSPTQGLAQRPPLLKPLAFPTTGSVASGNYQFESAFPNLDGMFRSPVMVTNDGNNDLIYVVDKPGTITVFENDRDVTQAQTRQVLDIRDRVRDYHEQGLLAIAFHPQFNENAFLYLYYIEGETDEESSNGRFGDGVLERVTLNSSVAPTGIEPNSRVEVLRIPQPGPDHKGGKMAFHPQTGLFYLSVGDGAYGATATVPDPMDPRTNNSAQQLDNVLGSFIRLQMLEAPADGKYYRIPADNPFTSDPNIRDEIWSYGHRNPWRWAFDQQAPYTLWQTEVGQSGFEEVNIIEKGGNYGWPICEGNTHRGNAGGDPGISRACADDLIAPVEGYAHSTGSVSVIGGFVYRGSQLPALNGRFIFGDYISKRIWSVAEGENKTLLSDGFPGNISSFGTDLLGEQIFVSTHGIEFGGGVSSIYRVVDRDAQAAIIPDSLSATNIFADLTRQFPASGVIEYEVNSKAWLDGAKLRHFISVPNGETIDFAETGLWDLPVGSVLVKHVDIPTGANSIKPLETSVLFKQTSGWAAANYHWNDAGTDAQLVKQTQSVTVSQFVNGAMVDVMRSIRTGSDCASCHTGVGSQEPRAIATRQLNRNYDYQGIVDNQLYAFDQIGLFTTGIGAASNYEALVDPNDLQAEIGARAKTYLDTNCASCHSGTLMDLRYDTPLNAMDIMNQPVGGGQFRMLPFDHTRSVIYGFQTSDNNRMPRGSSLTNPVAEELFRTWIDAQDARVNRALIKTPNPADDIRVESPLEVTVFTEYDNGFEAIPPGRVDWFSDNTSIIDVSAVSEAQVSLVPKAPGTVTLTAQLEGLSTSVNLEVLGGPDSPSGFVANALSSSTISLAWSYANGTGTSVANFVISRANAISGPYSTIATVDSAARAYVDRDLTPATRYYYQVRAISQEGTSVAATAFSDTLESGGTTAIEIETGNDFSLLAGESRQIVALAYSGDSAGSQSNIRSATLFAQWQSSDSQVVSVSSSGMLTGGSRAGTATISASVDGVTTSVDIVNQGPGHYVYFNNDQSNWDEVRIHVFSTSNGSETSHTTWPGDALEPSIEYGGKWLRYGILANMLGAQSTEVIFNCGSDACQTDDLLVDTTTPSWFADVSGNQWLNTEPVGAGASIEGTQIVLGRGQVTWADNGENLSGTLISPGAVVDIVADNPGTGQVFARWEGTATPYMLDPNNPNSKMLVPATLSLTLNAVFDSVTDDFVQARQLYQSAALGCSGCHGADGLGSPPLDQVPNNYSLSELTQYISVNMPLNNAAACTGDCAADLAAMILAQAYLPPAGVCNVDSLDDIVPQDRGYRLLTLYEYNNSVRDLLGLAEDVNVTSGNLPADIPVNGFKTAADTIFTNDYAQGYINAASEVADLAGNSIAGLVPSCGSDNNCIIRSFAKKVFRRPLSVIEENELLTLHTERGDRALLIALFSSPAMLYRSEVGELITSGDELGYYALTDHEVASLLSYTYWGTTPDNNLLSLADAGLLTTAEQIRSQLTTMLNDPRAQIAFERFILGWLNLDKDISTNAISESLKVDMKQETIRFVKNIVFGGGHYDELITADYSYMTRQLAEHYNLPWPGGEGWQQVFYDGENSERRGVIGHASVLTIQSAQEQTHPVRRGLFVRRSLMCQDFPPPPLGAALDPESDPTKGVRHRFEVSHAQPGCDACHQYIDGIGFGLESYNALGQFVTTEVTGNGSILPIDASGFIGSLNSAETFLSESEPVVNYEGLDELSDLIATSSNSKACFARQWFRYARGRREAPEDSCTLQSFGQSFKQDNQANVLDLMIQYSQTKNFTLRK
ncbi:starch-binding protein [Agarilytica rhodophyticola]|uniref:starch-binding protein n=1 Tax=Agarilytica rhodophyticola TaxID=1737490 RepID=UPI001315A13A|nr:starch-binding protein [Agarilytica rhodophyticola]